MSDTKTNNMRGWLQYNTHQEAITTVNKIDICLGLPTYDGGTKTWTIPTCLQDGYSPTATTQNYFVVIRDECYDCLTAEEKSQIISSLPAQWYNCGTPAPTPSGTTENYVGS